MDYVPMTRKERYENAGYKTIHIFGDLYLVRKHSIKTKRFSLYEICFLREG